jgi:hypothetical protein
VAMRVEIRMNDRKGSYVTTPSSGTSLLHVASSAVGGFVQKVSGHGASYARNVSLSVHLHKVGPVHAVKSYKESGGIAQYILNVGSGWK